MRVTISRTDVGLSAYIHKKDLEEPIISVEHKSLWGGFILLKNGWQIALPDLSQNRRLPVTVDARRLSS
ncbi:putative nitrogen fixation protein NifT [Rhizobium leguminosarum bv. viciae]|uniref:Nitrogen fixation protein NifT n=4 Tax=Rhizobium TaxID=379 RepID=A0AAW8PBU1_9HYPH|nr:MULTISPECIES: putative nitrogen fixation protein NifT [Rhizobium]MBA1344256.1 putative nitrogen fixation protein NifT [Rhizobium sp. WYCCWR 11146]MBX4863519.1 putative nitrogen fixation protein NifT [Rhizobium bangladeshense]MBX4905031.1 putative nitrogen fixation protein NifT [Rhizobium bangladeshense]MBX4925642.1 putative nitrogen fixation protein NifT [Rhizobium binae]MBX5132262.1 putative nitrogen fixation protein NifT [Rhizobium lentis]